MCSTFISTIKSLLLHKFKLLYNVFCFVFCVFPCTLSSHKTFYTRPLILCFLLDSFIVFFFFFHFLKTFLLSLFNASFHLVSRPGNRRVVVLIRTILVNGRVVALHWYFPLYIGCMWCYLLSSYRHS